MSEQPPEIGAQRATPSRPAAIRAQTAVIALSLFAPMSPDVLRGLASSRSGNSFTPCDKCGKPTRGVRCFKCKTTPSERSDER